MIEFENVPATHSARRYLQVLIEIATRAAAREVVTQPSGAAARA